MMILFREAAIVASQQNEREKKISHKRFSVEKEHGSKATKLEFQKVVLSLWQMFSSFFFVRIVILTIWMKVTTY